MKNIMRKMMVLLVLGMFIITGLFIFNNTNGNNTINEKNANAVSEADSPIMPYAIKWSFTANGNGIPYFLNNLIFICGNSETWIYNTQTNPPTLVGHLSIGNPIQLVPTSKTQVLFAYKSYYYIYNTSTYILSSQYNLPNNYIDWDYSLDGMANPLPSGVYVSPIFENVNDNVGSNRIVSISFNQTTYVSPDKIYYVQDRTYWANETHQGIVGFSVFDPRTQQYSIISLPTNMTMHLININAHTNYAQNPGSPPPDPGYYHPPGDYGSFMPTLAPSFSKIFIINNYTFALIGQMLTNISVNAQNGNVFVSGGSYYIIFVNILNHTSWANKIPQGVFYLNSLGIPSINSIINEPDGNTHQTWEYIDYSTGNNSVENFRYLGYLFSGEFSNNSFCFNYKNNIYLAHVLNFTYYYPHYNIYKVISWFSVINLTSFTVSNISFPHGDIFVNDYYPGGVWYESIAGSFSRSIIVNNTLYSVGNDNSLYAFSISANSLICIFAYPILSGTAFYIGNIGNDLLISSVSTNNIYDFKMNPIYPVTINILGNIVFWNISINPILSVGLYANNLNKTIVNSTHFIVNLFPISYYLNISNPSNYVIYSIQTYGKGIQMNANPKLYQYKSKASILFNITNDPGINITLGPAVNQVNFVSNINKGASWLEKYGLSMNITWQVKVMHGSKPSSNVFYSNILPANYGNLTNYTLIQNSTSQNLTFYLQNGTYSYYAQILMNNINEASSFIVSGNNTIYINFNIPYISKVNFVSNINTNLTWLSKLGLSSYVSWQIKIMHGVKPYLNTFYSNSLPFNYLTLTNFTLIQNTTSQNMTFYLPNGTYQYSTSIINMFMPVPKTNITILGDTNYSLNFKLNYPIAKLSSEVSTIPKDTAWVFQSASYGLYNTTIINTVWVIKGPVYYYGTGNELVAYFNVSGTYTLNLTVENNYHLKNSTVYTFKVIAFNPAPMYFKITKAVGYWTNKSATYIVNITYSYKLGAMANLQGIIDGKSYMSIQFVSFTNQSGNYTYEYFATFNPSNYPPDNHTVTFIAYTQNGYYNGTSFNAYFGSVNYGKPFNLIDFLGGPANFIMILLGILGTIIAIAEIKISRTSEVIIEAGGRESILKAKPVKESLSQKLSKLSKLKKSKSKTQAKKFKGGNKK